MKIVKMDRRYSQCRLNNYWIALHFYEPFDGNAFHAFWIKCKLQEHYGQSKWAMVNNPSMWYNEYSDKGTREIIYLRDESMLTFLQLVGALEYESN